MPHIHDLIDFTVDVFIVYNNKVLLRKHDKYNQWYAVGGHIELHEDPNQAALREVKEEVGLDIILDNSLRPNISQVSGEKELIPPYYLNQHKTIGNHDHISFVYFATANTDRIQQGEREISEDCHWFSREEIEQSPELQPRIKYYALQALAKLS